MSKRSSRSGQVHNTIQANVPNRSFTCYIYHEHINIGGLFNVAVEYILNCQLQKTANIFAHAYLLYHSLYSIV